MSKKTFLLSVSFGGKMSEVKPLSFSSQLLVAHSGQLRSMNHRRDVACYYQEGWWAGNSPDWKFCDDMLNVILLSPLT